MKMTHIITKSEALPCFTKCQYFTPFMGRAITFQMLILGMLVDNYWVNQLNKYHVEEANQNKWWNRKNTTLEHRIFWVCNNKKRCQLMTDRPLSHRQMSPWYGVKGISQCCVCVCVWEGGFSSEQVLTGPCGGRVTHHKGPLPLWTDKMTDRYHWKHYLPAKYVCGW